MTLSVKVSITFNEDEIRSICTSIHHGNEKLGQQLFDNLKEDPELFARFTKEIQSTEFNDDIMAQNDESCANDWLSEFYIE